jgi:hypothetical protein
LNRWAAARSASKPGDSLAGEFRWLESRKHIWIARKCARLRRAEAMLAGGGLHVASAKDRSPSVDAPFQARENFGIVAARGRMLSSVRPVMRQDDSRRPVWEFADWVQITQSVLEALW